MYDYRATAIGGSTSLSEWNSTVERPVKYLRVLPLIFKLIIAFFKYGNDEVFFHICGNQARESWDCPMNAEGLEIRHSGCGPKITIW